MRVNKGDLVYTPDRKNLGIVLADADDRQGYFWVRFGIFLFTPRPTREDICVPFAAIQFIRPVKFGTEKHVGLHLNRVEMEQLPQRWQTETEPTVEEMVQSLPVAIPGRQAARPRMPAMPLSGTIIPAAGGPPAIVPNPFANLELATQAQKIVAEASKTKLGIIEGMAKAEGMAQSENISAGLKEIMHQHVVADYQRLQAIDQYTDMEISRVLREARQHSTLTAIAGEDTHLAAIDAEGRDH